MNIVKGKGVAKKSASLLVLEWLALFLISNYHYIITSLHRYILLLCLPCRKPIT
jgi:hypothetical protein